MRHLQKIRERRGSAASVGTAARFIPAGGRTARDHAPFGYCPFSGADTDEWISWTEKVGIFHGLDRGAHAETYIEKDLYNWDQGIKRLSLGAFLSGLRSDSERTFPSDALCRDAYLPEEFGFGSMPNAALAIALCRSLSADSRFAVEQKMTFGEWAEFFQAFIASYIGLKRKTTNRHCRAALELLPPCGSVRLTVPEFPTYCVRIHPARSLGTDGEQGAVSCTRSLGIFVSADATDSVSGGFCAGAWRRPFPGQGYA